MGLLRYAIAMIGAAIAGAFSNAHARASAITVQTQQTDQYGDWSFYPLRDYAISSTTNSSGSVFGIICGKSCSAFVNFTTTCTEGHYYPAMVNSEAGAFHINMRCYVIDKVYLLSTDLSEQFKDTMETGGEIGFAIPLESGKFSVSRFSLTGSIPATKRAGDYTNSQKESGQSLRDFTL